MAKTYTVVTPVLSSTVGYVSDIRDQIAVLIRFIIMNTGWTSSLWEDQLISFRTMASKYEHSRSALASTLQSAVERRLSDSFRDYAFECNFTTEDYDPEKSSSLYTIKFDILFSEQGDDVREPALLVGSITVNTDTNDIGVEFSTAQEPLTL